MQTGFTNVKKRTEALDDSKELLLFTQADGSPVWTDVGSLKTTRADLEERIAKLKLARHFGKIQNVVGAIRRLVNAWLDSVFDELAPDNITTEQQMGDWIITEGYSFHRDGLTWVVKRQGVIVIELPVEIDDSVREEVLFMMRMEEAA